MKQKMKYSVLMAGLLALGLIGCQQQEAPAPAPIVIEPEAPAPQAPMPEAPPPAEQPAPGDMPSTPPSQ